MNRNILNQAGELRKLLNGFMASRVILTAGNYKVFDYLVRPHSAGETALALELDARAAEILLDALTGLGLLRKRGGKYRNTPVADRLLVGDAPYSMTGVVRHADTLWKNWSALDEVMTTGLPARKARDHEAFIRAMHGNAVLRAVDVVNALDLRGVHRALDLGGGPGTYSMELAKRGISVTLIDVPETISVTRDIVTKSNGKNVYFQEGDALKDPIGSGYDLVFISQVLHVFSEENNLLLLEKAGKALNSGGKIAIQEFYIDANRTAPARSALFSVNMLVNTEAGRCYTPKEIEGWLSRLGFSAIRERKLTDTVLVTGKKK